MHDPRHWDSVYANKGPDRVSWYRPHLERSLAFVDAAKLEPDAGILDVGGGASTFVDDLLDRGHTNVTVLDLSEAALAAARARLGGRASLVRWIRGDVTVVELPPRAHAFWHDRAVFHFLREPADRARYVDAARRTLRPGGRIVVATFGPNGPERCSGLEVVRFSAEQLERELAPAFRTLASATEVHTTPWGSEQQFVYCCAELVG